MRSRSLIFTLATALALALPAIVTAPVAAADEDALPMKLTTPVMSLRRLPGPLARTVATTRMTAQLDKAVQGGAQDTTCLTVQDPSGRTLYSRRPDLALIPASTLKLVVTAVALAKIGPTPSSSPTSRPRRRRRAVPWATSGWSAVATPSCRPPISPSRAATCPKPA